MGRRELLKTAFKSSLIDSSVFSTYLNEGSFVSREKVDVGDKRKWILAKQVNPNDPKSAWRTVFTPSLFRILDKEANIYKRFEESCKTFEYMNTFGVREVLAVENEKQADGKILKKFDLGDYKWQTYKSIQERVFNFSNGLLNTGLRSNQKLVLYCENRPEWVMTALACFRINAPIVTLYSTLGIDALKFGINQTEATHLVTSSEQLSKVENILTQIPNVTHIVVIVDPNYPTDIDGFKAKCPNKVVLTLDQIEEFGTTKDMKFEFEPPKADDLAVIMYTSGSTGNPKGVMISHLNILTSIVTFESRLAAIFHGVRIGYSNAQTMTDNSTGIKKGQKGDLRVLKPTYMASVPLVLERICKALNEELGKTSWLKQTLFQKAYSYKLEALRNGRQTKLLDKLIFKKLNEAILGGNMRLIVCGAALLSKDVQECVQVCLSQVRQAYALTETCAGGTAQHSFENDTMIVGSPVHACEVRLVDWEEGGYHCTDKPNPRGEIHIGGDTITMGYYKLSDKTQESYYTHNGIKYFATGDIGEILPNGNLRIIDRKKDLIKLQCGEYVSLNKIETILKLLPYVENCCAYAKPSENYVIAFICANQRKILEYAKSVGLNEIKDFRDAINSEKLNKQFLKDVETLFLKQNMARFEIPTKVKFVEEVWLPDTGLVTDSMKLKRKPIEKYYAKDIEILYS